MGGLDRKERRHESDYLRCRSRIRARWMLGDRQFADARAESGPDARAGLDAVSVGGRLAEITPHVLRDADNPSFRRDVIRLWCIDRNGDETIVYCEPTNDLPVVGEQIWWQADHIMFNHDRKRLNKVGYSHAVTP
jgi:hypothetical protein